MAKMHVLVARTWGDFDMPYDTPLFVSANKQLLEEKAVELNAARDPKKDLGAGEWRIGYRVLPEKVTVL